MLKPYSFTYTDKYLVKLIKWNQYGVTKFVRTRFVTQGP